MDAARLVLEGVPLGVGCVTVTNALGEAFATYATDVGATVTASAAIYVARIARQVRTQLDRHDRILFGDDEIDGREGIANIALQNERRSLENRDALREEPVERHLADD